MVKTIKQFVHQLAYVPSFWYVLYFISTLFAFNSFRDRLKKIKAEQRFFKKTGKNATVSRGPFEGMKYPGLRSSYSEMAPKIIGSYEAELFNVLNEVIGKEYHQVIDIGCAEGYYAVGLALKLPNANVYAYDINPNALRMCAEMAQINRVGHRIHLRTKCSSTTLQHFDFSKKSLIVCDCEGYELELFTKSNILNLANCDLLIELHDILGFPVKEKLLPIFENSHHIQLISSSERDPDLYDELKEFEDEEKRVILSECRDGLFGTKRMEWAYLISMTKAV